MPRGRPTKSIVRQNIIEVLYYLKSAYGYEIYKIYKEVFPKVTLRLMYYHLRKGVELGELKIEKREKEEGNFSWGSESEKIYYSLGPNAEPLGNEELRKFLEEKDNRNL